MAIVKREQPPRPLTVTERITLTVYVWLADHKSLVLEAREQMELAQTINDALKVSRKKKESL
jgi:hypothetical protein